MAREDAGRFAPERWTGEAEDCDFARYYARNLPIEDKHIECPDFALDVILDSLGADAWDPEAWGIFAAELRDRLERMPRSPGED